LEVVVGDADKVVVLLDAAIEHLWADELVEGD